MTRYAELSRKAEILWNAASVCDDFAMMAVWLKKMNDITAMMRGLSIDQAEQPATDRRNHVLSAAGLTIMDGYATIGGRESVPVPIGVHSLHDSSTGLPLTWGDLIERMNGR